MRLCLASLVIVATCMSAAIGAQVNPLFHGPIGTDYYSGVEQSKLIAQRTDILVAPILYVGQSPYHLEFPGSIALSAETLQRVYFEAAQSLINQGFRRILL